MRRINLAVTRLANLEILRAIGGSTITDVARIVSIPRPVLSSIFNKTKNINDNYARRIESGYSKPLGWLDFEQDIDQPPYYEKPTLVCAVSFIEKNATIKAFYDDLNYLAKADYLDKLYNAFSDPDVRALPDSAILQIMRVSNGKVKQKSNDTVS